MRIEDEIKQKAFKSEYDKLVINLIFTHNWLIHFLKEQLHDYEITITQYNILRILRGQYPAPISINLLKDRMLDKMSDTSRLVERLRGKGLVNRKICRDDRRKSDVKITEKGLELLKKLDYLDSEAETILSSIDEREAKNINELLDKLRG